MAQNVPKDFTFRFSQLCPIFILHLCLLFTFGIYCDAVDPTLDSKEEVQKLLDWSAPLEIQRNYPYFLSGFDSTGCPVWVMEYGKWDIRKLFEGENSEKNLEDFDKYVNQGMIRMYQSPLNYSTEENPVGEFILIEDAEGFDYRQFSHVKTVSKTLAIVTEFLKVEKVGGQRLKQAYSINNNFVATSVWNLLSPVIGDLKNRLQVFGTNEERWKISLLRDLPRESLPSWMGGFPNATPVQVYG